jgi:hypothetical protein
MHEHRFEAQAKHGDDVVTVHLLGTQQAGVHEPAYVWLPPTAAPPTDSVPVYIGRNSTGSLHLYLAHAPDVFTITGEPGGRRRLAWAIAEQTAAAGHLVNVVGDALGTHPPPRGVRHVDRLESVRIAESDNVKVVIYSPGSNEGLEALRALSAGGGGRRPILVAVGDMPRGSWSADVRPSV